MAEEKEKKKSKTVIYIVIAVIAIIVVFVIAGSNSDLTVYPVTCTDWFTNNTLTPPAVQDFSNCHHPEAMERETFHVDTTKNEITLTSPDTSDVIKLNDCTIQDGQHWSCGSGDFSKMPGAIYAATQISRSGDNFNEYGLEGMIFVTNSQWSSINNGKTSICGMKYRDAK